ncbi:MAG: hypothetical protein JSR93_00400 [Verrucomicrobia bacterium]|nr:hypothetical protein [Verrucomicrobiota bacterium]
MKLTVYFIFCTIGLIGSVNAGFVNENYSIDVTIKDKVLVQLDDPSDEYNSGWIKDFSNRCRKCGKPK